MADPRRGVSFENIAYEAPTFLTDNSTITYDATKAGGSAGVGLAVTLSADNTIALVADGDPILGKLIRVNADNVATVQTHGGMTLPAGNGATVTAKSKIVGALGAASAKGYIRNVAALTGSYVQATQQDIANGRGMILDAGTTTAVDVWMD